MWLIALVKDGIIHDYRPTIYKDAVAAKRSLKKFQDQGKLSNEYRVWYMQSVNLVALSLIEEAATNE